MNTTKSAHRGRHAKATVDGKESSNTGSSNNAALRLTRGSASRSNIAVILALVLSAVVLVGLCLYLYSRFIAHTQSGMNQSASTGQDEDSLNQKLSGWVIGRDGLTRYYDPSNHAFYSGWLEDGDVTYYIDGASGLPCVGWVDDGGKRYWLDDGSRTRKGGLLRGQWLQEAEGKYYLLDDGAAAVGWQDIDGTRYYFGDDGSLQTGWIDDGSGKRYWVKPEDETLAHHEWIEMDGIFQAFDDDGSWVNDGEIIPPDDEEHVSNMTARQRAVVDACDITPWPGRSLCAAWVSSVFVNAGEPSVGGDACDIARAWCYSADLSELRPGMVIAVASHPRTDNGKIWGHVCIYAGNGLVRDSGKDSTRTVTLGSWFAWYGVTEHPKWGWANGINLELGY